MDTLSSPAVDLFGQVIPTGQKVKREAAVDDHERSRDYLTQSEIDLLLTASRKGRFGIRDYAMLLLMFRHGLRVSELVGLRKGDLDLDAGRIWVNRKKGGLSTTQPLAGDELRALKAYLRTRGDQLPWVFLSSQSGRMTRQNFNYLIKSAGERAGLDDLHPHMIRHSCGHVLADGGMDTRLLQDWLGHRDIRHTSWYSRTSASRFEGVWKT